ncbi:ribosome maturation factor RimP [Mariniluteicoccus endophyticus]
MKDSSLTELLEPLLTRFDLELEALDNVPAGRRRVLRIVVDGDGPEGHGPTLDEISEATRAISEKLDETDAMGEQAYTLEVSSRGTSRPLTEPKHYRRNHGRLVKVTTVETEPITGRIVACDDETVTLEITRDKKSGGNTRETLAYAEITKALVQVEMNRKPRPGELDDPGDEDLDDDVVDEDDDQSEEDN